MQYEFRRIGDGRQAVLRETERAVTPFGGLAVLVELGRKMGVMEAVRERLPFRYRSNNASQPEHVLLSFWLAVAVGARRFSHLQMLRADRALQAMCGVRSFPTDDTVRNFFGRFGPAQIASFFPGALALVLCPTTGAHLLARSGLDRAPTLRPTGRRRAWLQPHAAQGPHAPGRCSPLSVTRSWCCTPGCERATRRIIVVRWSS